ncbi:TOBE domain-containing protein [Bowmanella dokdonensis]|uniref:TOBE domain-containing protein n=1 Tax=Bowmanella dokdonensis TaxID=751969 RepID=A0A939DQG3_9ALTE|nr:TOBE domain-containing protein [Bowmanella dokdonensis]MBN7826793.1 TOBE domain-containing protein [Bowmanella dokdonensis]
MLQWDEPYSLYHGPANRLVADFIGKAAYLSGMVVDSRHRDTVFGRIRLPLPLAAESGHWLQMMIRPHELTLGEKGQLTGRVLSRWFRDTDTLYLVELPTSEELLASAPSSLHLEEGQQVGVTLNATHPLLFDTQSARRLT